MIWAKWKKEKEWESKIGIDVEQKQGESSSHDRIDANWIVMSFHSLTETEMKMR